jgi:hypothetical protein
MSNGKSQSTNSLPTQAVKHWPTPSANKITESGDLLNKDGTKWDGIQKPHSAKTGEQVQSALTDSVKQWPTPTARDHKGANAPEGLTRKDGKSRLDTLPNAAQYQSQDPESNSLHMKSHELNPSWVEQLMGLPVGWTDCELAAME